MNRIYPSFLALCLAASGSAALAMEEMDHGAMSMQRMEKGTMDNDRMEHDTMKKDEKGDGMSKKDDTDKSMQKKTNSKKKCTSRAGWSMAPCSARNKYWRNGRDVTISRPPSNQGLRAPAHLRRTSWTDATSSNWRQASQPSY